MSIRHTLLVLTGLVSLAAVSRGQTLVVPATLPEVGGLNTAFRNAPRTYMALYTATNFSTITEPVQITGMQLRMSAAGNTTIPATWPSQPLSFTNFDVQLSQASASLLTDGEFLSATGAFASYQSGTITTTHSGGLTIPVGAYNNTGATNSFGPSVTFSTPYLYNPNESLLLYLTHTGYTPAAELQPFFASTDFLNGTADAIASTAGYQAANSNGFSSPYVVQFTFAPVPEPATVLAVAGLGLLGGKLLRRRRTA